ISQWAGRLLLLGVLVGDNGCIAFAQQSASNPNYFSDLADVIEENFPLLGGVSAPYTRTDAYASKDWCFQVEGDPVTNWWYFRNPDGRVIAHSSDYGLRIILLYHTHSDS